MTTVVAVSRRKYSYLDIQISNIAYEEGFGKNKVGGMRVQNSFRSGA